MKSCLFSDTTCKSKPSSIQSLLIPARYVSEDVTKLELQALAEQTYARLLDWEANLPHQLVVDKSTLDTAVHLPQVLVLQ